MREGPHGHRYKVKQRSRRTVVVQLEKIGIGSPADGSTAPEHPARSLQRVDLRSRLAPAQDQPARDSAGPDGTQRNQFRQRRPGILGQMQRRFHAGSAHPGLRQSVAENLPPVARLEIQIDPQPRHPGSPQQPRLNLAQHPRTGHSVPDSQLRQPLMTRHSFAHLHFRHHRRRCGRSKPGRPISQQPQRHRLPHPLTFPDRPRQRNPLRRAVRLETRIGPVALILDFKDIALTRHLNGDPFHRGMPDHPEIMQPTDRLHRIHQMRKRPLRHFSTHRPIRFLANVLRATPSNPKRTVPSAWPVISASQTKSASNCRCSDR